MACWALVTCSSMPRNVRRARSWRLTRALHNVHEQRRLQRGGSVLIHPLYHSVNARATEMIGRLRRPTSNVYLRAITESFPKCGQSIHTITGGKHVLSLTIWLSRLECPHMHPVGDDTRTQSDISELVGCDSGT